MQRCISRHPSARLTLLGTRLGAKVTKAVLMSAAAGRLTPEILSEAMQSSSTVRGHVQREAVKLLVVRVSLRTPQQVQWLLNLIGDYLGGRSLTGAVSSLTQRSLLYQVANFGLHGSAASAITTAAVQVGLTTCTLVTTNAAFWRKGDSKMSMPQFRYDVLTSLYTGVGSVAGGAAGAAVGSLVLPGVGTAFGSVLGSMSVGYMPSYLRDQKGPDDRRRLQARELGRYTPMRMSDGSGDVVVMYHEELAEVPASTPLALPPLSSALTTATPGLSESLAAAGAEDDAESASGDEMDVEGEEVVWLDFVRTPPTQQHSPSAVSTPDGGDLMKTEAAAAVVAAAPVQLTAAGSAAAAKLSSATVTSSTSSWDSLAESESESAREGGAAAGVRSFLRFSPKSPPMTVDAVPRPATLTALSSFADLEAEEDAAVEAQRAVSGAAKTRERFRGHARYVHVTTNEELDAEVKRFGGEDDLVLVFAEK